MTNTKQIKQSINELVSTQIASNRSEAKTYQRIANLLRLKTLYKEGMTLTELSRISGINRVTIHRFYIKHIEKRTPREVTFAILKKNYSAGMRMEDLSKITGYSLALVYVYRNRLEASLASKKTSSSK